MTAQCLRELLGTPNSTVLYLLLLMVFLCRRGWLLVALRMTDRCLIHMIR